MAASAKSVLFGDFSKYFYGRVKGIQFKRLEEATPTHSRLVSSPSCGPTVADQHDPGAVAAAGALVGRGQACV